jgi:SAM-dependent methyltransferase
MALADMFKEVNFLGVDLSEEFIEIAKGKIGKRQNITFEKGYLRERLANPERFDAVIFCSVLHEFYSYGEGISTVVKALADAHEILKPGGVLIIRDMVLPEYMRTANRGVGKMLEKVKKTGKYQTEIVDFEKYFGRIKTLSRLNHFLLKYMYQENWQRERAENYVPVSFEEYSQILRLLGMKTQYNNSYLIPYLEEKWKQDFNINDKEMLSLKSTGIIVAQKKE